MQPASVHNQRRRQTPFALLCICLLTILAACQTSVGSTTPARTAVPATATKPPTSASAGVQVAGHTTPIPTVQPTSPPTTININRPVLAFYYPWYTSSTWSTSTMSDLPAQQYNSNDDVTIDRQLAQASASGITGFISSWWGANSTTDHNFARVLSHAAALKARTGYQFASTIYFESDAPALQGTTNTVSSLNYILSHYANNANFFHWHGKPVLFFWDPLGGGRTLASWAAIRSQVDPNHQTIWSAEGVDLNMLSVFDGIHLFSAGYWGIQHNDMTAVDQGFRSKIDAYNSAHGTQKIWAAGVLPGYDDTRVPGRTGTYIVQRNNGATYRTSWTGAIASAPSWITITSFNEWFEGSMIEPSSHYGNLYLTLTQQLTRQWHG